MKVGAVVRFRVFLRSLAIQGSWNYRTLIGNGFAFSLIPFLRKLHDDPAALNDAVTRQRETFNGHPYLVGIALGAVSRLEAEGANAQTVERFKAAIRGPLGTIGDRLVWAGWRPLCLILSLALFYLGVHWVWVVIGFLLVYNAGHFALRAWGFTIGFRHGRDVGDTLRKAPVADRHRHVTRLGSFTLGVLVPLLLSGNAVGLAWPWWAAAVATALLGIRLGNAIRTPLAWTLTAFIVASFALGSVWSG